MEMAFDASRNAGPGLGAAVETVAENMDRDPCRLVEAETPDE